ncbi:MAG: FkbM family methyltransferase [Gammaproteobacteria bacterium]|nr:FkbM family methyltransferase [Gammaproteobacteria bacterium]
MRFGRKGQRVIVQCTTLDADCAKNGIGQIDVLKIDTEGFDLTVLQGSRALLQSSAIKFVYVKSMASKARREPSGEPWCRSTLLCGRMAADLWRPITVTSKRVVRCFRCRTPFLLCRRCRKTLRNRSMMEETQDKNDSRR